MDRKNVHQIKLDFAPAFDLSPYLHMQFMEPLGTSDGSVDAGWMYQESRWRDDLVEITRKLSPGLIRWGGCIASYYRWKEAVGPREGRIPMHNLCWNGMESNQIGTDEFLDFCRLVGADALITVNFESDGRRGWARPKSGEDRSAGPEEAADWIRYCNERDNEHRRRNGFEEPWKVPLWQIGNETSYDAHGFDCEATAKKTRTFAERMKEADPEIKLIAWGDDGWAPAVLEESEGLIDYIACHIHFGNGNEESALYAERYREDYAITWQELMNAHAFTQRRLEKVRTELDGTGVGLAVTEGHFALHGRNRGDVLGTWAAGVANARILNCHERNGDLVRIATLADFCGTRWMNNAIMIPVPYRANGPKAYMMPVASVMALFERFMGRQALKIDCSAESIDITASRTGSKVYLHVVNTSMTDPVTVSIDIPDKNIVSAAAHEIAAPPFEEVGPDNPDCFMPVERRLPARDSWVMPAASVTAIELDIA